MLAKLKALFQGDSRDVTLTDDQRNLASAALLVEVAVIDNGLDQRELTAVRQVLRRDFHIDPADLDELIDSAHSASEAASSVYEFTQLVNQHCGPEEKFKLIVGMWRIAYADGNLDKHEEYIVRKVADLIYVPHSEFIRAKHLAQPK